MALEYRARIVRPLAGSFIFMLLLLLSGGANTAIVDGGGTIE